MSVNNFKELMTHVGHEIVCVTYKEGNKIWNVSLECEDCSEVIMDFDAPKNKKKGSEKQW